MLTRPIELTAMEVLFLTDRVQNTDREDGREIAKPLLLKLGSAYLEMVGERPAAGAVTLYLTEAEAWLARSKFNSGDRCDSDPKLGIRILRKLYAMLLAFDAAEATGPVPDADPSASRDRRFADEKAAPFVATDDADLSDWDGLANTAG